MDMIPISLRFNSTLFLLLLLLLFLSSTMLLSVSSSSSAALLSFLETIQSAALTSMGPLDFDPKTFVDLPLRFTLSQTSAAFTNLPRDCKGIISKETMATFLEEFFDEPGSELQQHSPIDFSPNPHGFLSDVKNEEVRKWALEVHALWLNLSRIEAPSVAQWPDRHTLLSLPNAIVVPGARFREVYYWDTYWIVRGLIVSKMYDTAKEVVLNLISLASRFGFVPNGARTYYENRSQPPLLSAMVREVYMATGDMHLSEKALPILIEEHKFWTTDPRRVILTDTQGFTHSLSRYYANWTDPRPESFIIDEKLAEGLPVFEQKRLFRDIATAAESGWDFSSRWMCDRKNLSTLQTSCIIPADLNAFLLQMEDNIAFIADIVGNTAVTEQFSNAATARRSSINSLLWCDDMGQWLDYILPVYDCSTQSDHVHRWDKSRQNRDVFASNFVPLWCGTFLPDDRRIHTVIDSFQRSGLIYPAGIMTSLNESGEQWDFPNAWAPLQHMIIEGLAVSKIDKGYDLAKLISRSWLQTNFVAYKTTGEMHEKYDARTCGEIGGGGEYTNQAGFGWTNGVALALLDYFGWPAEVPIAC